MGKHLRINLGLVFSVVLGLGFTLCSGFASAALHFTSPILREANKLVDIDPAQTDAIVSNYLDNRKLTKHTSEHNPSTPRDDSDQRIRTPISSVHALIISAKSQFNLGSPRNALQTLEEATVMAQKYHLMFLELEIGILKPVCCG